MLRKSLILFMSFVTLMATETEKTLAAGSAPITYTLSMPEPQTHYIEVEMNVPNLNQDTVLLKMPVWTPGSYLVREFSRKVETVKAFNALTNQALPVQKTDKNTWAVASKGVSGVRVTYSVYSFELSVRTTFVDDSHATINPSSVCFYVADKQKEGIHITINPYKSWKTISTPLEKVAGKTNTFFAPDYDLLVDSPIEVGNQTVLPFVAGGIPHELVIVGNHNGDEKQMVEDIKRIVEEEKRMFNDHPCKNYTIFVINTETLYGGLEHLNSTMLTYPRWDYAPSGKYNRWLGLVSHEYFHLWNVKRLRPFALGPFDYDHENYTRMLWVAEGVTSYYDDLVLARTGLMSADSYLSVVASNISTIASTPADKVDPVTESSFDAWIKYYRSDENTTNAATNYYMKGAVLGNMLDLAILYHTKGEKSLEDVMRYLYEVCYLKEQRGYHDAEFEAAVEQIAGVSMKDFFEENVAGTQTLDYNQYLGYVGLLLSDVNANNTQANLGIGTKTENGKYLIANTPRNGAAFTWGLNVNDELLAIDNFRITNDQQVRTLLDGKKIGDSVQVTLSRSGVLRTIKVVLDNDKRVSYRIEKVENPTQQQTMLYKKWLRSR